MDSRHLAVFWRFRVVTAIGLLLAIPCGRRHITSNGLENRGVPTYSSASRLLVTQAGFPEGRVVLPAPPLGEEPKAPPTASGSPTPPDSWRWRTSIRS